MRRCRSRIGSGICVAADPESAAKSASLPISVSAAAESASLARSRIGSGICVAADCCIGSRICVAADPESAAESASLPISVSAAESLFYPGHPSVWMPLPKLISPLSRPSFRMPLAEANHSFVPAIPSDAISRS
ncbi:hypothetical protein D5086_001774 [Populus alba]|uniref:Uncharacterized protein n=1 Tax=Populus alba TaxID=43335 RepID=A0ACC4D083_POPAL